MRSRLTQFAWLVIAANLGVILWGAVVRATGSGAGCGSHWPLCNGEVVPRTPALETVIEFGHRVTSGIALLMVVALMVGCLRAFKAPHPARKAAIASMLFMLGEAAVGALLVRLDLVADDQSVARAVVMAIHLTNTFFLLGALALTAHWSGSQRQPSWAAVRRDPARWGIAVAFLGLLLVGASGAVTALGDTLFPAQTLAEGLRQDASPAAHFLIRLRFLHPLVAGSVGVFLFFLCRPRLEAQPRLKASGSRALPASSRRLSNAVSWLVLAQLAAGVLNLTLLAPMGLQLLHLLLADLLWMVVVLWTTDRWEVAGETVGAR